MNDVGQVPDLPMIMADEYRQVGNLPHIKEESNEPTR